MKVNFITGLILLFPFIGVSQGEFNNWYFGAKAGITFNSGSPITLEDGEMVVKRASVCVSDSLGNLLFYTDGDRVWNRNHQVMPNGTGLQAGRESDQTVSVVQKIDDDSSYYIFTMKCEYLPYTSYGGLHYSVINMRLDGGLGDIEPGQKEVPLQTMNDFPELMVTARHRNNRDAWVIVRNLFTANNFAAFLITAAGITTTPVISPGPMPFNNIPYGNVGTMRVSPDGTKLIYPHMDTLEYYNLNATTGQITPVFRIKQGSWMDYGWSYLEFSLDSRYLYCSTGDWPWTTSDIYQYDASCTDSTRFKESEILVGYRNRGVHLQRGPDGKIYGGEAGKDSLSIIHNPTLTGVACNYQPHALFLNGRQCYEGMPDMLQRYYIYIDHTGHCQWNPVEFNPNTWPPADSVHWNFGDPGSGTANFSTNSHAVHTYSSPGVYALHLFVRHNDKRTDTTSMLLTIHPGVDIYAGPDLGICLGDSVIFNAAGCTGCTFQWSNLTTGQMNIVTTQTLKTGTAGTYLAEATGPNGCMDQDTVKLITDSVPRVMNIPLSMTICSGDSTHIALNSDVTGTMFHWTATLISGAVTGFSADSGVVINQTLVNAGATMGMITYHIVPNVGNCVGDTVDLPVTVNASDTVKVSITASVNNICAGIPVTFTATPVNPGTAPVYQWSVNAINAGNPGNAIFTYTPANGDVVQCVLISSNTGCISNNPDTSNSITMIVSPNLPVSVSVSPSANPVCTGTSVTFTASPVNGGPTPSYQWKVNGTNAGGNSATFNYSPYNGDSVRCIMTSNLNCVTGNPAGSNKIIMNATPAPNVTFISCFDTVTAVNARPFKLKGGLPVGGQYSGPGVNSFTGVFTPSTAGTGLKTIVYSYSNVSLCSAGKSGTILVQTNPAFSCGNSLTDIRDNKVYPTVQIGTQCWMKENLDYGFQISDFLPQTDNCIAEKYVRNSTIVDQYSIFYQWDELMNYDPVPGSQGLCPPGWHVPAEADWTILFNYYQGSSLAGRPLQDSLINGFHALRTGIFYLNSNWSFMDLATIFWSSTSWGQFKALSHGMNAYDFSVSLYPSSRANSFPVRCCQD